MAKLHLKSLICNQSLSNSDQITLSFEDNNDPPFIWPLDTSITLTTGNQVNINATTGNFFSDANLTLSINNGAIPTPQGMQLVTAWPPKSYLTNFHILGATYTLSYDVKDQLPRIAIFLHLIADALVLIREFLLTLIDTLRFLARDNTIRYQREIRDRQQSRDTDRVE